MSDNTKFKPAWWLPNSHLQTIWPALLRPNSKELPVERERFTLYDGDFIDLDWIGREEKGPLILMLHGFEGSIASHYAQGMLDTFYKNGWRCVFMHFRGCSGEPNRLPRGYHSGETRDLQFVVDELRRREPDTQIGAIGYSLGGNVLLKWLGETSGHNPLHAAIAVSVPYDLHKAAARIQRGFSRFYQWYFLRCLRHRLSYKYTVHPCSINANTLHDIHSIHDFDNKVTAPLHGFRDADDYYTTSSSRQYLKTIKVPTLLLHAKDDPFMTEDVIPEQDELSNSVELEVTDTGGHVGFVSGRYPWRPEYWLDQRTSLFFSKHFKKI